jgi:hypothetical protein
LQIASDGSFSEVDCDAGLALSLASERSINLQRPGRYLESSSSPYNLDFVHTIQKLSKGIK